MLNFIKSTFKSIYTRCISRLSSLFGKNIIDAAALEDLEEIMLASDAGAAVTKEVIGRLKQKAADKTLDGKALQTALYQELLALLTTPKPPIASSIHLLVGINGSGKTSFAGKLAYRQTQEGKRVLLVAADTFRAAAADQLGVLGKQIGCTVIEGAAGQDPASVIFTGCQTFLQGGFDSMIIDTAGRLQTKTNLMHELAKISRIITKHLPNSSICTLLTIDSILGQNSFEQAKLFKECAQVNGVILTKMDSTSKGGVVFAIAKELEIPVVWLAFGEKLQDIRLFDAQQYVRDLLEI